MILYFLVDLILSRFTTSISILIYILNKTVKPILFKLTLPITGITLGLFYFVNNIYRVNQ